MSLKLRWCNMGNLFLKFRPEVTKAELAKLRKVAADMEIGQELSIKIERNDIDKTNEILGILKDNNYNWKTKGKVGNRIYIRAKKE